MSDAGWKYTVRDTFKPRLSTPTRPVQMEAKEAAARAQRARERDPAMYERARANHRARDAETREALATWTAVDVNGDGVVAGDEMDSLGTGC